MPSAINIQILSDRPGTDLARLLPNSSTGQGGREAASAIINELARISGDASGRLRVQIDSVDGVAASIVLTCTASLDTAGDVLNIGPHRLVGVASAPDATQGQWDVSTATDENFAISLAAAINKGPAQRDVIAVASSNTVTVTARVRGSAGNSLGVVKALTNASAITFSGTALAGGVDAGAQTTMTVTCGGVGTAGQTLRIGNVTFTLSSGAPANENQAQVGGSANATAVNLANAINAHSLLRGIVTASTPSSGAFTLTCAYGARIGALIQCATTITSCTLSSSGAFATTSQSSRVTDALNFPLGLR